MLCYVGVCYGMLCHVMLLLEILCYVILWYLVLCYAMLCFVMFRYLMLCNAMLWTFELDKLNHIESHRKNRGWHSTHLLINMLPARQNESTELPCGVYNLIALSKKICRWIVMPACIMLCDPNWYWCDTCDSFLHKSLIFAGSCMHACRCRRYMSPAPIPQ